jgi:four helix bundle protein
MLACFGMAKRVDELPLYGEVMVFWHAVNALLNRPGLRRDRDLRKQIEDANSSIKANLEEGFEQPSDIAFAKYVFVSKGSTAEVVGRLGEARDKKHITDDDLASIVRLGEPLGKMMGGFIKYLSASGFTDRGRHAVAPRPPAPGGGRYRAKKRVTEFHVPDEGND